ncbi:MAG: class I SAM-dependent methyltransferase [Nannocystaceae bacterium]|nr:class I SAM-dependent methyltransferase [Myxococcales bacterium]
MAIFTKRGYNASEALLFDTMAAKVGRPFHDRVLEEVAQRLAPGARLLDVGCGGGHFLARLADAAPGAELVGLDASPGMIARARRRVADVPRLSLVEASALALPFEDRSFDVVVSLGSIKHWPDMARGLRECARVLAPGGWLLVFEGDAGFRDADVRALSSAWALPWPARALMAAVLRRSLRAESIDLDGARALLAAIPELQASARAVAGLPAWIIEGRRPE